MHDLKVILELDRAEAGSKWDSGIQIHPGKYALLFTGKSNL